MSAALGNACDDVLSTGLLDHEYGIPTLWARTRPQVLKPVKEQQYYQATKLLQKELDKLVYMDAQAELRQLLAAEIEERYAETFSGDLPHQPAPEMLPLLIDFKTTHLSDFLASALPTVRAIHSSAATDADFTILNNLKKLYSHFNTHPANIRRLVKASAAHRDLVSEEALLRADIAAQLEQLRPKVESLLALHSDYVALENTWRNQYGDTPLPKRVATQLKALGRRFNTIQTFCDLLPQMILCQASSWYADESLREIMDECQEVAAKIDQLDLQSIHTMEDLVQADLTIY